ncbi:hypothetical protein [Parafrankia soli]|uniref:LmrA/YxaF family transcription factor n=1 Tax=Parafrankia soli TaxID=2599596 RepID=UPI003B849902
MAVGQPPAATGLATLLIAAAEGAVVMSRAQQSSAPFDAVYAQLRALAGATGPLPGR